MTTLTDPVLVEVPTRTAARPTAPPHPPRNTERPVTTDRRSQRFTVRARTTTATYPSWERAIGVARSLASASGMGTSLTDDFGGSRWDITPDGPVSRSAL